MTRLHTWMVGASSLVILIPLALLIIIGNGGLGLAAILLVLSATAATAFGSTLGNLLAAVQLRTEGRVRRGTPLTLAGPSGPVQVVVQSLGLRITVAKGEYLTLLVPNSLLTSSILEIPEPKEETT